MPWYIQLQCETRECRDLSDGPAGTSVKEVAATARAAGWEQLDGLWRCPICAPAFRKPRR